MDSVFESPLMPLLLAEPALLDKSARRERPERLMVLAERIETHLVSVAVQEGKLEQEAHNLPAKSNPTVLALGDSDAEPARPRVLVELEQPADPDDCSISLDCEADLFGLLLRDLAVEPSLNRRPRRGLRRLRADKGKTLQVVPELCEARKVLALDRSQCDTLALEHLVTALGRVELRSDGRGGQVKDRTTGSLAQVTTHEQGSRDRRRGSS